MVLHELGKGFANAFLMFWQVWWALVLGFLVSAIVQAWVPRERIQAALGASGPAAMARATGLGAASSSCSYAAAAIARSLFEKGASATAAIAFQIASTNLVWELGLVLFVLIGWQFTLAEFLGGIVMIVLCALLLRAFVSERLERGAREHAGGAHAGHDHHHHESGASPPAGWRRRLATREGWGSVGSNFRTDWGMLYKEIAAGFLISGFVGLLDNSVFQALFVRHAPSGLRVLENAVAGPVVAILSFVCSVGNVPLAAVLWSGGISFAGVLAFLFADLLVLPLLSVYRKYYGGLFALRISLLLLVATIIAALIVGGVFGGLGLIPRAHPSRSSVFGALAIDYKFWLDLVALAVFGAMFALRAPAGAEIGVA